MRFQDYIVGRTRNAAEEFFRFARAVPIDHLDKVVIEGTRSALDIAREVAICPIWAAELINGEEFKADEDADSGYQAEGRTWPNLDRCWIEFEKRLAEFEAAVKATSDEKLLETRFLPFEGGRDYTWQEMMEYPRWNIVYHTGQIAMIQLALGDSRMY